MKAVYIAGAILAILIGGGATFLWMGFILAGMPNSSPQQESMLWRCFWAVAAGGVVCAGGAVALIVFERPGFGILAGVVPLVAFVAFLIVAMAS